MTERKYFVCSVYLQLKIKCNCTLFIYLSQFQHFVTYMDNCRNNFLSRKTLSIISILQTRWATPEFYFLQSASWYASYPCAPTVPNCSLWLQGKKMECFCNGEWWHHILPWHLFSHVLNNSRDEYNLELVYGGIFWGWKWLVFSWGVNLLFVVLFLSYIR